MDLVPDHSQPVNIKPTPAQLQSSEAAVRQGLLECDRDAALGRELLNYFERNFPLELNHMKEESKVETQNKFAGVPEIGEFGKRLEEKKLLLRKMKLSPCLASDVHENFKKKVDAMLNRNSAAV